MSHVVASFIFRKMFLLHKLTSPNLTYAHCVAHKTSMPNQPYPLDKLSCLHPTPILASLFILSTAFLKSVSGFSDESDFFLQAWSDINRLSNGPSVAIRLAFHPKSYAKHG